MSLRPGLLGVVLLAATLAACGYTGGHASQVRQWAHQNSYISDASQVAADASDLERAVAVGSALKMRTVCGGLSTDAGTLYSSLDSPDRPLTHEIARSMHVFFVAAEHCAVARSTKALAVTRALASVKKAAAALAKADRRMAAFGVHSPKLDREVQLAWRNG